MIRQDINNMERNEELLERITPYFDLNHKILVRSRLVNDNFEKYCRYAVRQVNIPKVYLSKYNKLILALTNIKTSTFIDKNEIILEYPELEEHIKLLDYCLKYYPEVLAGTMHYVDVLFPGGDINHNEKTYYDPESDHMNHFVSQLVQNYVSIKETQTRIMEVGAGMGTCTRLILPLLEEKDFEYYFTDIGPAFLRRAAKQFSIYGNIIYKPYNVECTPPEEIGKFDIVIGVNVLHATSDILITLKNVRSLVKDGGMLILHEITARKDSATLIAGITNGWWLYKDSWRIPDSPLISLENWHKALNHSGFTTVRSFGTADRSIIIAI
jgi:polyketide synthase PksM